MIQKKGWENEGRTTERNPAVRPLLSPFLRPF